mmetsp:Transcript_29995/g.64276  ORF Transcript_29995/g.64276 Transcript_29995/m.64276 type:complete len:489 (+) Transcript_29995:180-1646(+)
MTSSRSRSVFGLLAVSCYSYTLLPSHAFQNSQSNHHKHLSMQSEFPRSRIAIRPPSPSSPQSNPRSLPVLSVATNPFKDKRPSFPFLENTDQAMSQQPQHEQATTMESTIEEPLQNTENNSNTNNSSNYPPFIESILSTYLGPRLILALVSILYATNFPLGSLMNDALPASAATSSRMVLASLVLSPFLFRLKPSLRREVLLGGSFVSMGYVSQSLALVDTSPALVSFLGSATVLVCPLLQWLVDKRPMGWKDAPQTWMAACLCLCGVAALELFGGGGGGGTSLRDHWEQLGRGDALSLVQAVGFGTGVFLSEKMMKKEPDQALSITAGLVGVTAFYSMIWCFVDGWMFRTMDGGEGGIAMQQWQSYGLPGLFLNPDMRTVAYAVAWTGIISTSTNFFIEITALGRVPSSEASVILATEPLWASLFAAWWMKEEFGVSDVVGGMLMIGACVVNTLKPDDLRRWIGGSVDGNDEKELDGNGVSMTVEQS